MTTPPPHKHESEKTAPTKAHRPSTFLWRYWNDQPLIVSIFLICAISGVLILFPHKPKTLPDGTLNSQLITKTPKELVAWRASISDDVEAMKQAKTLYIGKKILLTGKPEITMVQLSGISFRLDSVFASIPISGIDKKLYLDKDKESVFLCKIEEITNQVVMVDNCQIQQ